MKEAYRRASRATRSATLEEIEALDHQPSLSALSSLLTAFTDDPAEAFLILG
jgi:hypothetical protein